MRGPSLLREWMSANGHEPISASNALMTTMGEVRRLLSGKDVPHQALAERIEEWTGGAVPGGSWEPEEPPIGNDERGVMSHAEIAADLGIGVWQVKRAEESALRKLKRNAEALRIWREWETP
jgi:hypothetical protein